MHMAIGISHTILNSGLGTLFEVLSLYRVQLYRTEGNYTM